MNKQNKNFLYNAAYQLLTFIIPIITVPYVSRILGVNNVGIYSYTYSLVNYFMLLALLGINNYGSREIAKCTNITEVSKKFKSIYLLQLFLTTVSILLYITMLIFIEDENKVIMYLQLINLISVAFDINWFYFGKERFKITVTRNTIVKLISLVLIFTLVKNNTDLWIYTLILSVSTLISQMYLWIFIKKDLVKVKVSIKEIFKHLKPCLILFIPIISYSIYRIMDKTMIGSIANTVELGNYESAEKLISIPISIMTALGTVMLPYMSKKSESEIKTEIYKTFELSLAIVLPMIVGLFIISNDFSLIFFGSEYDKTGIITKLIVITVLFSCIANTIRTNFLIPLKKDKIYVTSTVLGAVANLVLNIIFIPKFAAYGACFGTVAAEFLVMLYQIIRTFKDIDYKKVFKYLCLYGVKSLLVGILVILIGLIFNDIYIKVPLQIVTAVIIYIAINYNFFVHGFFNIKNKDKTKYN